MIEPIHGTAYAFRDDGDGADPADQHYSDGWVTVMRLIGDEYQPLRRFPSREGAFAYVSRQIRADESRRESEGRNNAS